MGIKNGLDCFDDIENEECGFGYVPPKNNKSISFSFDDKPKNSPVTTYNDTTLKSISFDDELNPTETILCEPSKTISTKKSSKENKNKSYSYSNYILTKNTKNPHNSKILLYRALLL